MSRKRDERFEASERSRIEYRQAAINRAFPETQQRADGTVHIFNSAMGLSTVASMNFMYRTLLYMPVQVINLVNLFSLSGLCAWNHMWGQIAAIWC